MTSFSSTPGPFLRDDKELGLSREALELFKSDTAKLTCVIFQVQDDGTYPLGLDDTPNAIDFFIVSFC